METQLHYFLLIIISFDIASHRESATSYFPYHEIQHFSQMKVLIHHALREVTSRTVLYLTTYMERSQSPAPPPHFTADIKLAPKEVFRL